MGVRSVDYVTTRIDGGKGRECVGKPHVEGWFWIGVTGMAAMDSKDDHINRIYSLKFKCIASSGFSNLSVETALRPPANTPL